MTKEQMIDTKMDYAAIGEAIPHELAGKMIKDYNDARVGETATCFTIGKNIIESILSQPDCVSMRFYNAIDENGHKTLVYAGVDSDGKTILEVTTVDQLGKLGASPAIVADRTVGKVDWFA